jgi:aromatic ring-cleaving dioxygenase
MPDGPRRIAEVGSYHAHIYFDPETRRLAEWIREAVDVRFPVRLGRWHDKAVGPHAGPMFQIAFDTSLFASLVPWLMLNHRGLSILVHPNTRNPRRDHITDGLWIGSAQLLHADVLPTEMPAADEAGQLNSRATEVAFDIV